MQRSIYIRQQISRGVADALDRIGATVVALSLIGTLFTEQISSVAGSVGIITGVATVLLAIYNKAKIDADIKANKEGDSL